MPKKPIVIEMAAVTTWSAPQIIVDLVHEKLRQDAISSVETPSDSSMLPCELQTVRCCSLATIDRIEGNSTIVAVICIGSEVRAYETFAETSSEVSKREASLLWQVQPFHDSQDESTTTSSFSERRDPTQKSKSILKEILCCSACSTMVAVGSKSGHVSLLGSITGTVLYELRQVPSPVTHLSFSPTASLPSSTLELSANTTSPRPTEPAVQSNCECMLLCGYGEGTCRLYALPQNKLLSEFHATLPDDEEANSGELPPEVLALFSEDIREMLSSKSRKRVPIRQAAWSPEASLIALAPELDAVEIHKTNSLVNLKPEELGNRRLFRPRKRISLSCWAGDISFSPLSEKTSSTPLFLVLDIAGGLHGYDTRSWDMVFQLHGSSSTKVTDSIASPEYDVNRIDGSGSSGKLAVWLSSSTLVINMHEEKSLKLLTLLTTDDYKSKLDETCLSVDEVISEECEHENQKISEVDTLVTDVMDKLCRLQHGQEKTVDVNSMFPPLQPYSSRELPITGIVTCLYSFSAAAGIHQLKSLSLSNHKCALLAVSADHRACMLHLDIAPKLTSKELLINNSIFTQPEGLIAYPLGRHERWRHNNVNNWRGAHRLTHSAISRKSSSTRMVCDLKETSDTNNLQRSFRSYHAVNETVMAVAGVGGTEINIWLLPQVFGLSQLSRQALGANGEGGVGATLLSFGGDCQESKWLCCYEKHESTVTALSVAPEDLANGLFCSGDAQGWVHVWTLSYAQNPNSQGCTSDDEDSIASPSASGGSVVAGPEKYHNSEGRSVVALLVARWKQHEQSVVSVEFTRALKPERGNETPKKTKKKTKKSIYISTSPCTCNYSLLCDMFDKKTSQVPYGQTSETFDSNSLSELDIESFQVVSCDASGNVVTVEVPTLNAHVFEGFQVNEATGGWKVPRFIDRPDTLITVCSLARAIVSWKLGDSAITVVHQLPKQQKGMVVALCVLSGERYSECVNLSSTEQVTPPKSTGQTRRGNQDVEKEARRRTEQAGQHLSSFEVAWCTSLGGVWISSTTQAPKQLIPESDPIHSKTSLRCGIRLFRNWIVVWGESVVVVLSRSSISDDTQTSLEDSVGTAHEFKRYGINGGGCIVSCEVDAGKLILCTEGGWALCFDMVV